MNVGQKKQTNKEEQDILWKQLINMHLQLIMLLSCRSRFSLSQAVSVSVEYACRSLIYCRVLSIVGVAVPGQFKVNDCSTRDLIEL